ncbi:MAG: helix-turn-helix domain-containing protein [Ardenticatenaceae bacterium]|nr:helix-turn-helix domain-containing protein [Ardenticatenaceae bacterium]
MDELGHILREARETKGYTLAEVQEQTRISLRFLEALEDGEYDALPTAVHVRGFLRNYARFLGLDPEPLLNRYLVQQANRPHHPLVRRSDPSLPVTPPLPLPQDREHVFFDPVNMEVNSGVERDPESALRLVIILALIIAIALIANRFIPLILNNQDGNEALFEGITEAVQSVINNEENAEPTPATLPEGIAPENEINTSTSRNDVSSDFPTPAPTRPSLPPSLETIRLRLDITERTWMEVTIDGDVVFSGWAKLGDPPYEWEALEEAKVNTGNAVGVFVTINDIELGRMGDRGQNQEEVWQTTPPQQ